MSVDDAGRLFKPKSVEDQTDSLASFMPGGRPFLAARIDQTNLRKLLYGLAFELYRVENTLNDITYEHQIDKTTGLIDQWESALGIPWSCFGNTGTIEERRSNVLLKLKMHGIQTEQDFKDLAALLGYVIDIQHGSDRGIFPFREGFPIYFFDSSMTARFTQIINIYTINLPNVFPLDFPINFDGDSSRILECLFNKLIPTSVKTIFHYELPAEGALITESLSYYIVAEDGTTFISLE